MAAHIATPDEADRFAAEWQRELVAPIAKAVERFPQLAAGVFDSAEHHLSDDAGHPWAAAQIGAFLDVRAHFVRLNPDSHYVESAMRLKPSRTVQNPAGKRFTAGTIRDVVEPEERDGGPTDKDGLAALAAELADRVEHRNWSPTLDHVLVEKK
jgi:hypothetical protein